MDCNANKFNLTMWQGSTFGLNIYVKDANNAIQNLNSFSARMQLRPSYDSPTATETLTSSNGEIAIVPSTGEITISLAASRTANIEVDMASEQKPPRSTYVYDLELVDSGGSVSKLLYGDVTVYGEVTRI